VISEVPEASPTATPFDPGVLEMATMVGLVLSQMTSSVMVRTELSW
jgi:hypothetical protein